MCLKISDGYTNELGQWMRGQPGGEAAFWKMVDEEGRNPFGFIGPTYYRQGQVVEAEGEIDVRRSVRDSWSQEGGGLHVFCRKEDADILASAMGCKVIRVMGNERDLIYGGVAWAVSESLRDDVPCATFRKVRVPSGQVER